MDCNFVIIDDDKAEDNEEINLMASVTSGMASFAPGQNMAKIRIIDDDGKLL